MFKKGLSFILALLICISVIVAVSATASAKALKTPSITKLTSTANGVKLTWGKVNGAAKYRTFIKSGSKWVKMGDTTKTSWTYTKAKSGKTYTFTVRCLSKDSKKFTSAYNKKGWSIKYKKPVNWRNMYKNFVMNKKYLKMKTKVLDGFASSYNTKYPDNIYFGLHDLNHDKIPELVAFSGYQMSYIYLQYHFYTIKNGKVVYLKTLGLNGVTPFISTVSGYYGLFTLGGDEGYHTSFYVDMKDGKVTRHVVAYFTPAGIEIKNKKLYQVECKSEIIDAQNTTYGRDPKRNLNMFAYNRIKSMGWNAFLKKYGY